jgi:hypothetical protein
MRIRSIFIAPLLSLVPLAVRAQAAAPHVQVRGHVVDYATHAPVPGALVVLGDAHREARADATGAFVLSDVPAGTHTWVISRVGYAQWEESTEVSDGDEFTIALLPRPEVLEGITAIASQIETRRRNAGVSVRSIERETLRLSGAPTAIELVNDHLGVRGIPCPSSRTGERSCAYIRGGLAIPAVFIDEQRAVGGLDDLMNLLPANLYTVESYSGGTMIRVITIPYAEALAHGRAMLLPIAFYRSGGGMPALPDREDRARRP